MKPSKTLTILVSLALTGFLASCSTSQQATTFNALSSIESVADSGYNAYVERVIKGTLSTNSLPQVSQSYNSLHSAIILAAQLDQANSNALVTTNITIELGQLLNLIQTATTNH